MKQTLRYAAAAVAVLAAFACSKNDDATPEPGNPGNTAPYTIAAAFDESPETRISMEDNGSAIELKWKTGDKIYVVNSDASGSASAGTLYTFTASSVADDGKTAAFTCADYPADAAPAYAIHKGTKSYSTFNPAAAAVDATLTLAASSLPDVFPLYARYDAETQKLVFTPLCAVLKLNVTLPAGVSGTASNLRIGSVNGDAIFYRDNYDIIQDPIERSDPASVQSDIPYTGSEVLSGGALQTLYIPVRPGNELAGQSLEINLLVGNSLYSASIKGGNLEAGKCYPLTLPESKWAGGAIYESGAGTAVGPYMIENEAQLRALAKTVLAGQRFLGKYFQLKNNIDNIETSAEAPWLPIGTFQSSFYGNFNGDGKTISGTFHLSDKNGTRLGFFGSAGAPISNLTIEGDVIYQGTLVSTTSAGIQFGGIAGYTTSRIMNCMHKGSLTAENPVYTGTLQMGGIIGQSGFNISGCTQTGGTISANIPKGSSGGGSSRIGGIVGFCNSSGAKIHTCRNESNIVTTSMYSNSVFAGALAGYNSGDVYSCSTFSDAMTIMVNGTAQSPVKAIGSGNAIDETEHTD